jgi:hypothetical protein
VAREPEADGLEWFNPYTARPGQAFVWEDGVHVITKTYPDKHSIIYKLRCGTLFSFVVPGTPVMEARLKLPKPNCPECLIGRRSRSRQR